MVRLRNTATLLVVVLAAFYLGSVVEFQYGGYAPPWVKTLLLYQPPKEDVDLQALEEVFTTIRQQYVERQVDARKLTQGAAAGMVQGLGDRFSRYMTPEEYKESRAFLEGSFVGIGITILEKGELIEIVSVLPNTPAGRAGLQASDVITSVDGQSTRGWTADQAKRRIRGEAGTRVSLGIDRKGQALTKDLTRETITIPSVASRVFDSAILYIRVFEFGEKTPREFDQALKDGLKGSVDRVVLDLRDNPGGLVDSANDVISEFVRQGASTILVRRDGKEEVKNVTGSGRAFENKLVILLNANSASASEIAAGAFKDYSRGRLVGTKTFGKGSVQEDFTLRNGDLHLTIAQWVTPKHNSIEKIGITPDDVVTLDKPEDQYAVNRDPNDFARDKQLAAALTIVKGL